MCLKRRYTILKFRIWYITISDWSMIKAIVVISPPVACSFCFIAVFGTTQLVMVMLRVMVSSIVNAVSSFYISQGSEFYLSRWQVHHRPHPSTLGFLWMKKHWNNILTQNNCIWQFVLMTRFLFKIHVQSLLQPSWDQTCK